MEEIDISWYKENSGYLLYSANCCLCYKLREPSQLLRHSRNKSVICKDRHECDIMREALETTKAKSVY